MRFLQFFFLYFTKILSMWTYTGCPVTVLRSLNCKDGDLHVMWITLLRTVTGHPVIEYICKLCMCLYLLNLYLICDICVIIFISATDEQVYVSFIVSVLFYHFCWLFLKTQVYMLYQAIVTKAIKYSSVANKGAQSLSICGIKIHEFTFTLFIQIEAGLE